MLSREEALAKLQTALIENFSGSSNPEAKAAKYSGSLDIRSPSLESTPVEHVMKGGCPKVAVASFANTISGC